MHPAAQAGVPSTTHGGGGVRYMGGRAVAKARYLAKKREETVQEREAELLSLKPWALAGLTPTAAELARDPAERDWGGNAALFVGMQALSIRERRVIGAQFGLWGQPISRAVVGRQMNVTQERVRQIESQALKKLAVEVRR